MKKIKGLSVSFLALLFVSNFGYYNYSIAAVHSAGTNVSNNGTIYMVTESGQRRPYTSAGAFLSYGFNSWATVVPASAEDMALPEGSFIPPRDGKIVCSDRGTDKGTCYLITNGKRAAFVSGKVFTDLGFSFSKALYGDVSFLDKDSDITNSAEQHRSGVLINKGGTIYLVSPTGLMGIPSQDVLKTWGYSFNDVVTSNTSDSSLSQVSVIANRQGAQLSPNNSFDSVSESSLIQGYIDTYPGLPTQTISAPLDAAQVIELAKKIEATSGSKLDPFYPYLSSMTLELFAKAPSLKAYWESTSAFPALMETTSTNVQVFEGGTSALYTRFNKQVETNYTCNNYWVFRKESGVWKWDIIGGWKYNDKLAEENNPTGAYIVGSGLSDIAITEAVLTPNPQINDPNTFVVVMVRNNAQTTIKKFHLIARLNTEVVDEGVYSYELKTGEGIILAIPLDHYWQLSGTPKTPGQYTATIEVSLGNNITDNITTNNKKEVTGTFQQKVSGLTPL